MGQKSSNSISMQGCLRRAPTLDGTKMLANIRVGDVLEIVEAKVGPSQAYHLCRRPAQGRRPQSMGWYSVEFGECVMKL